MPEESVAHLEGLPETTESEEMYLLTVAFAEEDGHCGALPMTALAEALGVSGASANEMVRKLAGRGLLQYEPYRGARLTDPGRGIALRVLRTRRLWTAFLSSRLGMVPADADVLACRLEHLTPADVVDRLAAHLGDPGSDPLGRPIPAGGGGPAAAAPPTLLEVRPGVSVEVAAIDGPRETRGFLARHGIARGRSLAVLARGEVGVLVEGNGAVDLSAEVARLVRVVVVE
jgi:DtxR family Mn-dependent transcriptional regulator